MAKLQKKSRLCPRQLSWCKSLNAFWRAQNVTCVWRPGWPLPLAAIGGVVLLLMGRKWRGEEGEGRKWWGGECNGRRLPPPNLTSGYWPDLPTECQWSFGERRLEMDLICGDWWGRWLRWALQASAAGRAVTWRIDNQLHAWDWDWQYDAARYVRGPASRKQWRN